LKCVSNTTLCGLAAVQICRVAVHVEKMSSVKNKDERMLGDGKILTTSI